MFLWFVESFHICVLGYFCTYIYFLSAPFNILYLSLAFAILWTMCLEIVLLQFTFSGNLQPSWILLPWKLFLITLNSFSSSSNLLTCSWGTAMIFLLFLLNSPWSSLVIHFISFLLSTLCCFLRVPSYFGVLW